MNKLSLFSGIGGIDLAAHWAGMKTVAFCEREPFPQKILQKHWPGVPIYDDVCTLTKEMLERDGIGAIDIISAGYPCQPFSYAGKRRGAEDDRHLWPEVKRILSEIRPRWFVGENVAGHVSLGLDDVLADLESLDYTAQAFVIPAAAVRASHRRDRVFIVGYTEHDGSHRATIGRGADKASNNHPKREDEAREPSGASGRANNAIVAYSESEQNRRSERPRIQSDAGADGQNVAYSASEGLQKWGQSRFAKAKAEDGAGMEPEFERCGEVVADTCGKRRQECDASASGEGLGQHSRGNYAGRIHGAGGATQPGMGRGAHELSTEMDGGMNPLDTLKDFIGSYPQPALMGQPQYEWEPSRVATGVKNRVARLKALGNAVDPLQIFPIMYAIKVVDDWLAADQSSGATDIVLR